MPKDSKIETQISFMIRSFHEIPNKKICIQGIICAFFLRYTHTAIASLSAGSEIDVCASTSAADSLNRI
jgi:hypothetical protein